jgi:Uma2 family endonuclease
MVQAPKTLISLAEFLQYPETKPASEYISGEVIPKPLPQGEHSALQGEIVPAINRIFRSQKIARAFPELRCTFGARSIVPDVAVFAWEQIPRQPTGEVANVFLIPPTWVIEILSPDQSQTKVTKNILHCLAHGTQMGWLIDPVERTVFIYLPNQPVLVCDRPEQQLPTPDFARALQLTVGELFSWLMD